MNLFWTIAAYSPDCRKSLKIPKGGNQKIPKGGNQNLYIEEEHNAQKKMKKYKRQTTIYKTYSGAPEG